VDAEYESRVVAAGFRRTHGRVSDRGESGLVAQRDRKCGAQLRLRYTAQGTTVEIRLERRIGDEGEDIVVRVLDSGPGVPEEALEQIFQPFYRIDDARNRQTGGAGLGLSIADRAVRLHGAGARIQPS